MLAIREEQAVEISGLEDLPKELKELSENIDKGIRAAMDCEQPHQSIIILMQTLSNVDKTIMALAGDVVEELAEEQ